MTPREAAHEALVMGLRLAQGIDTVELCERIGIDRIVDDASVSRMEKLGLLQTHGSRLRVTPAGRLLLDSILAEIAA